MTGRSDGAMEVFLDAYATGDPSGAIGRQEARGQSAFVTSDTLPTEHLDYGRQPTARQVLEAAGVVFGEPVDGDPLFQHVTLPAGWRKVPTEHSMWSDLLDDRGRKRAAIFYKAAFYDRGAHLRATPRYSARFDYAHQDATGEAVARVFDADGVIHTIDQVDPAGMESWEVGVAAKRVAAAWLDERYPDWRNPMAYWDDQEATDG